MIPIRLGTIAILQTMVASGLVNSLAALVLVYVAQGLPLAIFILSEFMRQVSDDLKNAGRIDGLNEYVIFFRLVLPLVRPAMATVAACFRPRGTGEGERVDVGIADSGVPFLVWKTRAPWHELDPFLCRVLDCPPAVQQREVLAIAPHLCQIPIVRAI